MGPPEGAKNRSQVALFGSRVDSPKGGQDANVFLDVLGHVRFAVVFSVCLATWCQNQ